MYFYSTAARLSPCGDSSQQEPQEPRARLGSVPAPRGAPGPAAPNTELIPGSGPAGAPRGRQGGREREEEEPSRREGRWVQGGSVPGAAAGAPPGSAARCCCGRAAVAVMGGGRSIISISSSVAASPGSSAVPGMASSPRAEEAYCGRPEKRPRTRGPGGGSEAAAPARPRTCRGGAGPGRSRAGTPPPGAGDIVTPGKQPSRHARVVLSGPQYRPRSGAGSRGTAESIGLEKTSEVMESDL